MGLGGKQPGRDGNIALCVRSICHGAPFTDVFDKNLIPLTDGTGRLVCTLLMPRRLVNIDIRISQLSSDLPAALL